MDAITLRPHHVKDSLAIMQSDYLRAMLMADFYCPAQEQWAREMVDAYKAGKLDTIVLVPGYDGDDICARCDRSDQGRCLADDTPLTLGDRSFLRGPHDLVEIEEAFNLDDYTVREMGRIQSM